MNSTQKTIPATQSGAIVPPSSLTQVAQASGAAFPSLRFVLINRPQRGGALFAHTAAVFESLGLYRGESVTRNVMLRAWGETALKYHAGRFHRTEDGYSLNDEGFSFFGEQRAEVDPEQAAGFFELLTVGKTEKPVHNSHKVVKPV